MHFRGTFQWTYGSILWLEQQDALKYSTAQKLQSLVVHLHHASDATIALDKFKSGRKELRWLILTWNKKAEMWSRAGYGWEWGDSGELWCRTDAEGWQGGGETALTAEPGHLSCSMWWWTGLINEDRQESSWTPMFVDNVMRGKQKTLRGGGGAPGRSQRVSGKATRSSVSPI